MTSCKTEGQLRAEMQEYRKRPHLTKKHRPAALAVVSSFWKQARRLNQDMWDALTQYEHPALPKAVHGSSIKSAFRDFLLEKQDGRCCYCRCWLVAAGHARPIEHILPRSTYKRFSIDFWNLAVACVDCNLAKTKAVWGSIPDTATSYPDAQAFPDMYHPRYHIYNAHVRYVLVETNAGGISLYRGVTAQGKQLCLDLLDKIAVKRALLNNHPQLKSSMAAIDGYRNVLGAVPTPALNAFADLIDARLMELIGD